MDGGGGGTTQTIQQADPWSGVQPHLLSLYPQVNEALDNRLPFFPNKTFAGIDPLQEAGMLGGLGYAGNVMQPATLGFQDTLQNYMRAPLDITNDQAVQNMFAANRSEVNDALTRDWLPQIGSGAVAAGQYGGSRQGIAEGLAVGEASKALANANARTALGAMDNATRLAGLGMSAYPGALQMGLTPYQMAEQVGGQYRALDQAAIDEAMSRYYFPQDDFWNKAALASNLYSGAGAYGTSTGTTTAPGASLLAGALGGGMLGAAVPSALGSLGAFGAGAVAPPAWPFMLGGALLGGLFS